MQAKEQIKALMSAVAWFRARMALIPSQHCSWTALGSTPHWTCSSAEKMLQALIQQANSVRADNSPGECCGVVQGANGSDTIPTLQLDCAGVNASLDLQLR